MKIGELGEFGLIDRVRRLLPAPSGDVIVGIGDDVAVIAGDGGRVWLATCDVQVEGSHFVRGAISPRDLGAKALAINLSDVAASGGTPRFALASLGLPEELDVEWVDGLYAGLRSQADTFGVCVVGGNMSRTSAGLFIDLFLLGEASREEVVLRSGARPGDRVLVTGSLGDASAGVALLLNGALSTSEAYARVARARRDAPTPRVREGALIGRSRLATAMADVSDGLAADLGHICERSACGARLFSEALPVAEENRALSRAASGDEWRFALRGGEDYELIFTAPAERAGELAELVWRETGTPVSTIGEIVEGGRPAELVLPGGRAVPIDGGGWDHFHAKR